MPQHITVVDYDPDWPRQFQAEAARIRAVLGDNCAAIYHIGSTAVPGLAAKPILDIMLVVENLEAVDRAAPAFEAMGYEYLGEFGIPGRAICGRAGMSGPTSSTSSPGRTGPISPAIWRCGTTFGPTGRPGRSTPA